MALRIYADTSVIGGYEDEEFLDASRRLIRSFAAGEFIMVLSELTLRELDQAPSSLRAVLATIPEAFVEILSLTDDAHDLASAYIEGGVLPESKRADALHIAIATLGRVDVLVSWNFRDMVNLHRIHGYNSVNLRRGYPMLEIRSPVEVLHVE
jgi:hypothetical protein